MKQVFPGGGDVVYAIFADGTLKWYEHKGFNTGVGFERADSWAPPKNVGRGWDGFVDVFSGGEGRHLCGQPDGHQEWYRHWDTRRSRDSRHLGRGPTRGLWDVAGAATNMCSRADRR